MLDENGNRVKEYWKLPDSFYLVESQAEEGVVIENLDDRKTLPSHLGSFVFSHSKRVLNVLEEDVHGFESNSVYYQDTNSLYIQ